MNKQLLLMKIFVNFAMFNDLTIPKYGLAFSSVNVAVEATITLNTRHFCISR